MSSHPPTEPDSGLPAKPRSGRWVLPVVMAGTGVLLVAAVLTVGFLVQLRDPVLDARSPSIGAGPAGITLDFDRGEWTNAVLVVNGSFTLDIGKIPAGSHIIPWNAFSGTNASTLNVSMVSKITLRGEVDGAPHVIDCTATTGQGYTATSYVIEENPDTPKEAP